MIEIDMEKLQAFEEQLNPVDLDSSSIKVELIGYGEISAIFMLEGYPYALKRLPIFSNRSQAEGYLSLHDEYCKRLAAAGINLPAWKGYIVEVPDRPVSLYVAQAVMDPDSFVHKILGKDKQADLELIEDVIQEIEKVWEYNGKAGKKDNVQLAIDGQLSNWVIRGDKLFYVDTSTPLLRKDGVEQMQPDLILQSAPSFLRWLLKLFFLDDVLNRYYIPALVYTDIIGNLFKEQHPELIPDAVVLANKYIDKDEAPLTVKKIEKYYKEDKLIWALFLSFRRIDRFIKTKILHRRYEFILPGKIKR